MDRDKGRRLVIVSTRGGEPWLQVGAVRDLAKLLSDIRNYDYNTEVLSVHALDEMHRLVPVMYHTRGGGEFDGNDYAHVLVEVVLPGGWTESAWFRIDGRA